MEYGQAAFWHARQWENEKLVQCQEHSEWYEETPPIIARACPPSLLTRKVAISPLPTVNLKRRREASSFDDGDSENIDPVTSNLSNKKNKFGLGSPGNQVKIDVYTGFPASKATNFAKSPSTNLKPAPIGQIRSARLFNAIANKPRAPTTPVQPTAAPTPRHIESAPAVAGRSPKSKRIGILSRRRMTASPFTRVNPPMFASNGIQGGLPLSIDAALSGTIPSYKPSPVATKDAKINEYPTLDKYVSKKRQFEVYEESEEVQDQNVVIHRACNLDISDDESSFDSKEGLGKENIPPTDGSYAGLPEPATSPSAMRRNLMTDGPRTPLADLEARDFYGEGCDAFSHIIVPGDSEPETLENNESPFDLEQLPLVKVAKSAPIVDIWESGSAKDGFEVEDFDEVL